MQLPSTFEALIKEADNLGLYNQLVKQLNKDFILANIELEFNENILPKDLKLLLHDTIFTLIQDKFADYLNLLYIIDVSEKNVRALDGNDTNILSEQVAFLILLREWQKVWYRNAFK